MNTPIIARDLAKQAPHSPRERIAGFVIASRAVDKCRASLAGTLGEYHYDCPLDNLLFSFKPMKTNPLKEGALTENSAGIGTVTRWMIGAKPAQSEKEKKV